MEQIEGRRPAFGKFRVALREHGIGVTAGYELVAADLLRVFKIGNATYIELSEFDELPRRLKSPEAQKRLIRIKRGGIEAAA